jgi:hypothetical protein
MFNGRLNAVQFLVCLAVSLASFWYVRFCGNPRDLMANAVAMVIPSTLLVVP